MVRGIASRESRAAISNYSRANLSRARARACACILAFSSRAGPAPRERCLWKRDVIGTSRSSATLSARKRCSLKSRFLTACGAHPCRRASIIVQIVKEADYANALDNGGFARVRIRVRRPHTYAEPLHR